MGGGLFLGVEHARGLGVGDRLGLAAGAEEAGHLRRVLDEVVDLVVHLELGEDVAGHELALGLDLLAALDLGHGLGRHLDLLDEAARGPCASPRS